MSSETPAFSELTIRMTAAGQRARAAAEHGLTNDQA